MHDINTFYKIGVITKYWLDSVLKELQNIDYDKNFYVTDTLGQPTLLLFNCYI